MCYQKSKCKKGPHESNLLILCPACLFIKHSTTDHIFPQQHFGPNGPTLQLCWECHKLLETKRPRYQKLYEREYLQIIREFLKEGYREMFRMQRRNRQG